VKYCNLRRWVTLAISTCPGLQERL